MGREKAFKPSATWIKFHDVAARQACAAQQNRPPLVRFGSNRYQFGEERAAVRKPSRLHINASPDAVRMLTRPHYASPWASRPRRGHGCHDPGRAAAPARACSEVAVEDHSQRSLNDPGTVLLYCAVHGVGCEVEAARPGHRAQFDSGLAKQAHIPQTLKYAGRSGMEEAGKLDRSFRSVVEAHAETKTGQHLQ